MCPTKSGDYLNFGKTAFKTGLHNARLKLCVHIENSQWFCSVRNSYQLLVNVQITFVSHPKNIFVKEFITQVIPLHVRIYVGLKRLDLQLKKIALKFHYHPFFAQGFK